MLQGRWRAPLQRWTYELYFGRSNAHRRRQGVGRAELRRCKRRSLLRQAGLAQRFTETGRRVDKAWLERVQQRHGEFGIQFRRLRQGSLRLRRLVCRRVERRKGSVT